MVKHSHTAPVRLVPAPYFLSLGVLTSLLVTATAVAADGPAAPEDDVPHESDRGMPALLNIGLPVPAQAPVAFSATAGYGYIDPVLRLQNSGTRLRGSLGGAVSLAPFLLVGVDVLGRMDMFSSADDDKSNLYGEPRLTARFFMPATDAIFWGAELDARIVGAEAPDIEFGATSPSLRGLLGVKLARSTWLGAELGFHLDNSARALPAPAIISSADRVTVGASSSFGIPWGVGVSHRLGLGTEILGELSGEVLVGADAPGFFESPWGLSLGARHPVNDFIDVMLSADVSFSARPVFDSNSLVPIQPRAGGLFTAIFRLGGGKKTGPVVEAKVEEKPVEKPAEEAPKEPGVKTSSVTGSVVDEGGRPLADAEVTMTREGEEPVSERTFANGSFEFKDVPEGPVELVIKTPGYDKVKLDFKEGEERSREVVLYPSLPAGQVKGEVRDLKGNPVAATLTITPGDKVVQVSANGTFELELAPGNYTVHFEHPDLSPQKRFIRVQDRGVVILNIGLSP